MVELSIGTVVVPTPTPTLGLRSRAASPCGNKGEWGVLVGRVEEWIRRRGGRI